METTLRGRQETAFSTLLFYATNCAGSPGKCNNNDNVYQESKRPYKLQLMMEYQEYSHWLCTIEIERHSERKRMQEKIDTQ